MVKHFFLFCLLACLLQSPDCFAGAARPLLDKGWAALVQDNDVVALQFFAQAYDAARKENNTADMAEALLDMGICTYGSSFSNGLGYATRSLQTYKNLEAIDPVAARMGRARCLQLISTIYMRQGKFAQAIGCSSEAMDGLPRENDSTGTLGLVYTTLGDAYDRLGYPDSAEKYYNKSLQEHMLSQNPAYLPVALTQAGRREMKKNNAAAARDYFQRAFFFADSTGNRQAIAIILLSLGEWHERFNKNSPEAVYCYVKALKIGNSLSDKIFSLRAQEHLISLYKAQGNFQEALTYRERMNSLQDSLYNLEKDRVVKSLEAQFEVSEKDRQLKLARREKEVTVLTNSLLWGGLVLLAIISAGVILFLRRINRRDKELLHTQEALTKLQEEQQRLQEQQMRHELEFKESQLSALTLQMLQKNELMQELKEKLEQNNNLSRDTGIHKLINQGLNQDKDWSDFNTYFESINKNFYTKLKQNFPDISPNDLKICALIRLNLSSKDMASILNISPDSVKTARYRLRKKLQLNTEDNLTEFILSL
jgi:tetratricopeptide (TPR) repeat protein